MIKIILSETTVQQVRDIDDFLGEMISSRPKTPKSYQFDSRTLSGVLFISFTYPEDEIMFKLKFPYEG